MPTLTQLHTTLQQVRMAQEGVMLRTEPNNIVSPSELWSVGAGTGAGLQVFHT